MNIAPWRRIELALTGPLTDEVRRNMRMELLASLAYGPFYAVLLFIPVVLQRLGASPDEVALYQAQSYVGFALSAFSVRFLPRRGILIFLGAIWVAGRAVYLFTPLLPSVTGLLVLSFVFWLSDSFPSPGYVRVVQKVYPAHVRARTMSVVRLGMGVGMLAFTPVAGWLLDTIGHAALFPIAAVFGIGAALIFMRIRMPAGSEDAPNAAAAPTTPGLAPVRMLALLGQNKAFLLYVLSIAAFGLAGLIPIAFYPAVLVDRLQLSYTDVSLLGLAQSLVWLAGYVVWGRWMDRLGGVRTLQIIYLSLILYPLCHWFAPGAWWLLPAYLASGLANAGVDLAFTNVTIDLADPERVAEYAAIQRTIIGIRGFAGPLIGVWLNQIGVPMAAIFALSMALYGLAAALVAHPAMRRTRP